MDTLHTMYAMLAYKSYLHPIAALQWLQPGFLKWVLKLQHINCTTVVVECISYFAAYIIDGGGQGWTAAVVSLDKIWARSGLPHLVRSMAI